jgi:hypothetical protein
LLIIELHGLHEEEDEHGQGKWEGKHHHISVFYIDYKESSGISK